MADGDFPEGPEGKPGSVEEGVAALGDVEVILPPLETLKVLTPPTSSAEWLWWNDEPGESVSEYEINWRRWKRREKSRKKLYLRRVGDLELDLEALREFLEIYLCVDVCIMEPGLDVEDLKQTDFLETATVDDEGSVYAPVLVGGERVSGRYFGERLEVLGALGKRARQLHIGETVLRLAGDVPKDALSVIGVCGEDLYEQEDDLMQMGLGDKTVLAGVVSVIRYRPGCTNLNGPLWHSLKIKKSLTEAQKTTWLKRVCGTLAHESLHTLHLEHCIWWRCLMNGSGSLTEDAKAPLNLCPVCLKKLQIATRTDIAERANALSNWLKHHKIPVPTPISATASHNSSNKRPKK